MKIFGPSIYAFRSMTRPVVSATWLSRRLAAPDPVRRLVCIDSTYFLPNSPFSGQDLFENSQFKLDVPKSPIHHFLFGKRLPGNNVFFDLDHCAERQADGDRRTLLDRFALWGRDSCELALGCGRSRGEHMQSDG